MADKTKKPEDAATYTDEEVTEIMELIKNIYAIDDAIYNGTQLNRPPGYVAPLHNIRKDYADRLVQITSKGVPAETTTSPP